jgi:hypothetical protein
MIEKCKRNQYPILVGGNVAIPSEVINKGRNFVFNNRTGIPFFKRTPVFVIEPTKNLLPCRQ